MKFLKTAILSTIALMGATTAFAQEANTEQKTAGHDVHVYGKTFTDGDKFDGLIRKVGFDRMIPPHGLEVCYEKTTHIIFPAEIVYVDLGV